MGEKGDLQERAEELGVDFKESDTIADLKEKIVAAEKVEAERDSSTVSVVDLEQSSQALFGVPRSVFVGAKSAGFISGDRLTKDEAAEGIQKFLNYGGE